jgi:hypothetical protein
LRGTEENGRNRNGSILWVNDRPFLPSHGPPTYSIPGLFTVIYRFIILLLHPIPPPSFSFFLHSTSTSTRLSSLAKAQLLLLRLACSLSRSSVRPSLFLFTWHICPSKFKTTTLCPSLWFALRKHCSRNLICAVRYTQQWMLFFASPRPCALS